MKSKVSAVTAYRVRRPLAKAPLAQSEIFSHCLDQAEICCEQARGALRCQRFGAARGLLATAAVLYQRALSADGVVYPAVEMRLRAIEAEVETAVKTAKQFAGTSR